MPVPDLRIIRACVYMSVSLLYTTAVMYLVITKVWLVIVYDTTVSFTLCLTLILCVHLMLLGTLLQAEDEQKQTICSGLYQIINGMCSEVSNA